MSISYINENVCWTILLSSLGRRCHLVFTSRYYTQTHYASLCYHDAKQTLKDFGWISSETGMRQVTSELCTCFCLCWHRGRSLGSERTSCCSWAGVNFWAPSKHTITHRLVRTKLHFHGIYWSWNDLLFSYASLRYQICLQTSILSAAFWILEPRALSPGFVWFLLQIRCVNEEGLQRDTSAWFVRNETQAHRLCCFPPSPALQNVVGTPPWS